MASERSALESICRFKILSTNDPATAPMKRPRMRAIRKFPIDTFKEFHAFDGLLTSKNQ